MRKTFAILLLFVHVFNLAGYHFIYNYYKQQATVQIDGKIDRGQYQPGDLVEVNIPTTFHMLRQTYCRSLQW